MVRAEPALHKAMFSAPKRAGASLNRWVTSALERGIAAVTTRRLEHLGDVMRADTIAATPWTQGRPCAGEPDWGNLGRNRALAHLQAMPDARRRYNGEKTP